MVKITLFELHLEDAEFLANAPFSAGDGESDSVRRFLPTDDDETAESGGSAKKLGLLLAVALVVAVVAAVAAKKTLGGSDDGFEPDVEIEEEVAVE